MIKWIYLSPHLDDAVLSCGGMIWEQVQAGQSVEVWSVFTGDPVFPLSEMALTLHNRWQVQENAQVIRRREDNEAVKLLGAHPRHFPFPDVIYRRSPENGSPIIQSNEDLFKPIHPHETGLVQGLQKMLVEALPVRARLVSPLTLGGHTDHRLVRAAAEKLDRPLWFYADYPYVEKDADSLPEVHSGGWRETKLPVSAAALEAWKQAVAAYTSQISTFWNGLEQMRSGLQLYWEHGGGQSLWQRKVS